MLATLPRLLRLVALAGLSLLVASLAGCGINNIPTFEEQAKAAWAEVMNQYKRRNDLVPNLVETVRGYAQQEEKVLKEVVEARAKATQMQLPSDIVSNPEAMKQFIENQGQLGSALSRLLVITENYPELKSNQNFLQLQSQLEGVENRVAIARRDYIESVRVFNTEIKTIPGRWWRFIMYPEAKEMATFDIPEGDQQAPKVDFGTGDSSGGTTSGGSTTNN
jgi:LemA protein